MKLSQNDLSKKYAELLSYEREIAILEAKRNSVILNLEKNDYKWPVKDYKFYT